MPVIGVLKVGTGKSVFSLVCEDGSPTHQWRAMHFKFVSRKEERFSPRTPDYPGRATAFDEGQTTLSATCRVCPRALLAPFPLGIQTKFIERKKLSKLKKITISPPVEQKDHTSRGHEP